MNDTLHTEARAAEALLDKRLRVNLPAPWLLRLCGVRSVTLLFRRPVYATLLRMSRLYVTLDLDLRKLDEGEAHVLFAAVAEHGIAISRIIATGLIRNTTATFFLHRPLAWYLRRHMEAGEMAELAKLIVFLSGAENFASIIRSVAYMKVTAPTLSQAQKGS